MSNSESAVSPESRSDPKPAADPPASPERPPFRLEQPPDPKVAYANNREAERLSRRPDLEQRIASRIASFQNGQSLTEQIEKDQSDDEELASLAPRRLRMPSSLRTRAASISGGAPSMGPLD